MASAVKESHLLSTLESPSNPSNVFSLFSHHLRPFTDLSLPNKSSKKQDESRIIRTLAKQFLPFLNKSLSILPKRLSVPNENHNIPASDLFHTYKLCLDCLEIVSTQLSCKPHTIQLQRLRLIYCLQAWDLYADAEIQGFRVLESLRNSDSDGKLLPDSREADAEYGMVVVEVVASIFKCVMVSQPKCGAKFRMVLRLLDEVQPWFRVLDANAYERLHRTLITYLGKCALYLVREALHFDEDSVLSFCVATLKEYFRSSTKDQIYKFARQVFSSMFALEKRAKSLTITVVTSVLQTVACEFQDETGISGPEFVDLVSYCANKCRAADSLSCISLSKHLEDIAAGFSQGMPPLGLIFRLYSIGLSISTCDVKFKEGEATSLEGLKHESAIRVLLDEGDTWQNLAALLGSLESYFLDASMENCVSQCSRYKHCRCQLHTALDSIPKAHISCSSKSKKAYLLSYLDGLKFLCQPLAELINLEKRRIVSETEFACASADLLVIQDALHQLCDACLFLQRCVSDKERGGNEHGKTMLSVAMAAFILSIRTQFKKKISVCLIKDIIASHWIQPRELKYLFASLYNMGVILYRNKQLEEASKALKLCYRASWTCVGLLCKMFVNEHDATRDDRSEEGIVDFVSEACSRSAFFLDVLQQCDNNKFKKFIVDCLENWSMAENLLRQLPGPMPMVKQWVKVEYKLHKNLDQADACTTLYKLLSSSKKFSKRTIGKILEQELLAYEEICSLSPNLSHRMQVEILDILLTHVYVMEDTCIHRSRVLIWKARASRTSGTGCLRDSIQCLSEAISIMDDDIYCEPNGPGIPSFHQLAVAYCLRAICIQEAEPNSKQVFEDIRAALSLWLRIPTSDDCHEDAQYNMLPENTILLLYNVIDLLSLKGYIELHHDIYKLILRLFKWKNVQLETCVALLWECRRLSHALCPSPINEAFILNLSEHAGGQTKSVDYWLCCLKISKAQLVGFCQNFFSLHLDSVQASNNQESAFQSDITNDKVKDAATKLISSVPLPSRSAFLAGNLYYDLCERLVSNGRLSEALSSAKEAHRLRTLVFQEKFKYSVEKQFEKYNDDGRVMETRVYGVKNFQVLKSAATEVWPCGTFLWDMNGYYISPWNVLQCYLESTLQVGVVNELIGNGAEAETFLSWGKSISCSWSLLPFIVAFCSALGNLYRKKQLWNLAEKELQSAKKTLIDGSRDFSCLKCRLMMEATLDRQLGDLSRNRYRAAGSFQIEGLSHAKSLFNTAIDKLSSSVWKNCVSCPTEANDDGRKVENRCEVSFQYDDSNSHSHSSANHSDKMEPSAKAGATGKRNSRNSRRSKNTQQCLSKDQDLISERGSRLTRSKRQSLKERSLSSSADMQSGVTKKSSRSSESNSQVFDERQSLMEGKNSMLDSFICNKRKCWCCLPEEVMESGLLGNLISLKWEFSRRRLLLRVLDSLGKCLGDCGELHQAYEVILQSVFVLSSRNTFCHGYPSVNFLLDIIGKEFVGDAFAVERAATLYNLCWFTLKHCHLKDARSFCCDLSHIQLPKVLSLLVLAFVLSREVPLLFQKVAKLLAALYLLSVSNTDFFLPSCCNELSESHWASYFHQASLGTHISYQFFSNLSGRHKSQFLLENEESRVTGSACIGTEKVDLPRLAPDSTQDLVNFVQDFFENLPCSTVICITLLGGAFASLLQELTCSSSSVHAWLLLSRLTSNCQPVVILLPVDSVLEESSDDDSNSSSRQIIDSKNLDKPWHSPWGSTVVDDVAPAFKLILEENYISSSDLPAEDTKKNRCLWWKRRKQLDDRLGKLLRNLEDSWLGPWRHVLLGERSSCNFLDSVHKKLVNDLRSKCKVNVNETLCKVILGGGMDSFNGEACITQLCLKNGCYIGTVGYYDEDGCRTPTSANKGSENRYGSAIQLIHEALTKLEQEDNESREPVILVLDSEIQMLPWENIPTLRKQEVYRMPSVGSISAMLKRCHPNEKQVARCATSFPLIDPLDAFYLLNPGGDLSDTQSEFESWFRDQNLEGKAGTAPTPQELALVLRSHDLFLYFGHGSGAQYISRHEIEKLEKCSATFLMGCSSGSLMLNGCYTPQGMPLSYLLAGSPVIVANLWEVTDKDIDRFGKAMLEAWLRERSNSSCDGCNQCNLVTNELAAMNIKGNTTSRKRVSRKKLADASVNGSCKSECGHRRKIGSFMSKAREACNLPFLIGAAPVCYGLPTGITRKKGL